MKSLLLKSVQLFVVPLFSLTFLTNCDKGPYTINVETDGVTIKQSSIMPGESLDTTIEINTNILDGFEILPDEINVISGETTLPKQDYTYIPDERRLTAEFKIPADKIVGNITVDVDLASCEIKDQSAFDKAIYCREIEFAQINTFTTSVHHIGEMAFECSPTTYHETSEFKVGGKYIQFSEDYAKKENGVLVSGATRESRDEPFKSITKWSILNKTFKTPSDIMEGVFDESYRYTPDAYDAKERAYILVQPIDQLTSSNSIVMTFRFKNDKLVSLNRKADAESLDDFPNFDLTVAYSETTPEYPTVTPPYKVSISKIDGLTTNVFAANPGETLYIDLTLNEETKPDYELPDYLEITIGGVPLASDDYSYTKHDDLEGNICIGAEKVVGDVEVELNLATCKIDNEDEFNDAILCKNDQYVQISAEIKEAYTTAKTECSPTQSYTMMDTVDPSPYPLYTETYVKKETLSSVDVYSGIYRNKKEDDFQPLSSEMAKNNFMTPDIFMTMVFSTEGDEIKFENFSYDSYTRTYRYECSTGDPEDVTIYTLNLLINVWFPTAKLIFIETSLLLPIVHTNKLNQFGQHLLVKLIDINICL